MAEIIIKNPDRPATARQLFALFKGTGKDYRGKGLTVKEASDLLQEVIKARPDKTTCDEIYAYLMKNWDKIYQTFMEEIGIKDTLHFNSGGDNRHYTFLGSGFGYAWVKYDKRSPSQRKLFEEDIFYSAITRFKSEFIRKLDPELKKRLEELGNPAGAIITQNRQMDLTIKSIALTFCINKFKLKNCCVYSRLD